MKKFHSLILLIAVCVFFVICIFFSFDISFETKSKVNPDKVNPDHVALFGAFVNNPDTTIEDSIKIKLENTKVEFDEPICLPSSDNIAIPVLFNRKHVDKGEFYLSFFNIAIIDKNNKLKRMLFDTPVIIENITTFEKRCYEDFDYFNDDENVEYSKDYNSLIFFELFQYSNKKKDYRRLFVYNLENDILTQLSPDKCNLVAWHIMEDKPKIVIRVQLDSDNNNVFDKKDDHNIVVVNPNENKTPNPLFDLESLKLIKLKLIDYSSQ